MIKLYVDGSCRGNGKTESTGGFGVVVVDVVDGVEKLCDVYSKQCNQTTNNQEELKAILWAMFQFGHYAFDGFGSNPVVYSDSSYCVNTFNDWMFRWANNNWIKSDKKVPENLDLIQAYFDHYQKGYRIDLRKIKGHAGNRGNELVDKLAKGEINTFEEAKMFWDTYIK